VRAQFRQRALPKAPRAIGPLPYERSPTEQAFAGRVPVAKRILYICMYTPSGMRPGAPASWTVRKTQPSALGAELAFLPNDQPGRLRWGDSLNWPTQADKVRAWIK
jgi:hypothetical protein